MNRRKSAQTTNHIQNKYILDTLQIAKTPVIYALCTDFENIRQPGAYNEMHAWWYR